MIHKFFAQARLYVVSKQQRHYCAVSAGIAIGVEVRESRRVVAQNVNPIIIVDILFAA